MSGVSAIVLDTSAFSRGRFDLALIQKWASICKENGAVLLLPEVVVWELVEHEARAHVEFTRSLEAQNKARRQCGLREIENAAPVGVEGLISSIQGAGADIAPLSEESALGAVMDQVLQRGAGSTKKGTKTGAADSSWVRSVLDYADDNALDAKSVHVVSGDHAALDSTCRLLGAENFPRSNSLRELNDKLGTSSALSEAEIDQLESLIREQLSEVAASLPGLADLTGISEREWRELLDTQEPSGEWELLDSRARIPVSIEIDDAATKNSWSGLVSATVRVKFDVEEAYARQDQSGDSVEYTHNEATGGFSCQITAYIDDDEYEILGDLGIVRPLGPSDIAASWPLPTCSG